LRHSPARLQIVVADEDQFAERVGQSGSLALSPPGGELFGDPVLAERPDGPALIPVRIMEDEVITGLGERVLRRLPISRADLIKVEARVVDRQRIGPIALDKESLEAMIGGIDGSQIDPVFA